MPTLPLYDLLAHPNAWHYVIAPGGYEWWRFDAQNASGLRLLLDFFDGDAFSDAYRRAYTRYRRRPTRAKPPVPRDYPCFRFVVMAVQERRDLARAEMPYPPGAFRASADGSEISIGPHSMRRDRDGVIRLAVSGEVSIELTFRPVDLRQQAPELRQIASKQRSTTHFQVMNISEYLVTGTLRGLQGEKSQVVMSFDGRGRHDHFYGTGPIDQAMQQFIVQHLPPAASSVRP